MSNRSSCIPRRRAMSGDRRWLETLEDRSLFDAAGLGSVASSLREAALAYDINSQIRDMTDPAKNSLQQGRAEGYLFGDIGSLIGNTIGAIPGVDNKTIGQAFTTAGDFAHLATFLFTGGLSKMGTPVGIALHDLEQARSELSSNPSGAWHLANAVLQSLTAGTPIAGLNEVGDPARTDLNQMAIFIQHAADNLPDAGWQAQFDADAAQVESSLPVNYKGMLEGLSDVLALAGDVSALTGGPVGAIVGDALGTAHDALNVGLDLSEGQDPTSDLGNLSGDGLSLINDSIPSPKPTSQPLSVTVNLSGAGQPQAGANFNGLVATFSDPNATSSPAASSYTAYISWGDGSASFGQISAGGGASYNISGSHVYPAPGSYSVDVIVTGLGEKGEGAEDIAVVANSGGTSAAPQGMTVTGQTITTGGTTAVSGIAATLNAPASGTYAAAINWGDGTTATAQLSNKGNGQFQITGSHTYAHAGDYMTRIEVGDKSGNLATAFGFVNSPPPTSSMSPLPARETSTKFTVSWSGSDPQGPGIAGYDIYYSDDGSPFAAGLVGTTLTSATFTGQLGHTYAFYSVATDDNGNLQPIPQTAQATTVVVPSDPNGQYVVAVYQDVLGRAPDPGGLQYWTDQLDSGTQISSVAQSIAHSAEYYANFVIRPAYLSLLGRAADDTGVAYWTQQMQNGLTDQQLEASLVASDEFFANAGGTNTAWVDAIYKLLLGRTADAGGVQYWDAQLTAGVSRLNVAERIAGSTENDTQLINADYEHYLGRPADAQGLAHWLNQFALGMTNEDVVAGFTGSAEYFRGHTG